MAASNAYDREQARAAELLSELQILVGTLPAPDDDHAHLITWSHVEGLSRVNELLADALALLTTPPC